MKPILSIILFFSMVWPVCAQKGTNAWAVEVGTSTIMMDEVMVLNPGFNDKYLHGVGRQGQLTATLGVWAFKNWANEPVFFKSILLGYRSNGKRMYIEPAAGVGIYTEKSGVYYYGYKEGYTYYMCDISLEAGYKWKNLTVAFQPQVLTDLDFPLGEFWPMLSFKLGYQFSFRPRPAQPAVRSNRNSGP